MLTRQWQMGEFLGDDAGSPIFTQVQLETTQLRKYQPVNARQKNSPMQFLLRRASNRCRYLFFAHQDVSLDIRLLAGRHWLKLAQGLPAAAIPDLMAKYPIHLPDLLDINNKIKIDDAAICAHPETWSNFAAVARRRMDGVKLYLDLKAGNARLGRHTGVRRVPGGRLKLEERFVPWFEKLFYQPAQPRPGCRSA